MRLKREAKRESSMKSVVEGLSRKTLGVLDVGDQKALLALLVHSLS
jgi:hypothetical protein